jgi:transposase InsO family protein
MNRKWASPLVRDAIVDFVAQYSQRTGLAVLSLLKWIGIGRDKFYEWLRRYGQDNLHNASVPRDFWLEDWERQAIIRYHFDHPLDGYRALTYMMIDADVVVVSPSTVYRVLSQADLLTRYNRRPSKKGTGFVQPLKAHQHWHIDVSYLNICGTFYYFCGVLDGYSRYIVHWEIREAMTEADIEIILQRARERFPGAKPRIISDNGPQFVAKDFKTFIRQCEMTHVRTSPYYPQSNGKIERFNQSLKVECIRPGTPLTIEQARALVSVYVEYYNDVRLHGAIGYIAPLDKLQGRAEAIQAERRRKLHEARERRKARFDSQRALIRTPSREAVGPDRWASVLALPALTTPEGLGQHPVSR